MRTSTFQSIQFCFLLLISLSIAGDIKLIMVNYCNYSVWPGTLGNPGHASPENGGFLLATGQETVCNVPVGWAGRIWARTGCNFDRQGQGSCETGDCGGVLHCNGMAGTPPATVVEASFGTSESPVHFYDVSLVDGFNIPVAMSPVNGGVGCGVASCDADVNVCCPSKLEISKNGRTVGCMSACMALQSPEYCCTGEYSTPERCKPSIFSHLFKAICPRAYSFAYDDSSSLNLCKATRYLIAFCPPPRIK